MLTDSEAYSGFAVKDVEQARRFYAETLGLGVADVEDEAMRGYLMRLQIKGSRDVLVYAKPDHVPATFTILNFPVPDIDSAVDELVGRGVTMLRYDGFDQDERGIAAAGPRIAWFTDPSGNILSVAQA
ncbi:VOC family protein [Spongisporangium articulatum]|uniref:VOC family protein n=1 Tax=Spongisporangium articulatum TaxID=3362603 RepID=A0ABW8APY1_9ACTN